MGQILLITDMSKLVGVQEEGCALSMSAMLRVGHEAWRMSKLHRSLRVAVRGESYIQEVRSCGGYRRPPDGEDLVLRL